MATGQRGVLAKIVPPNSRHSGSMWSTALEPMASATSVGSGRPISAMAITIHTLRFIPAIVMLIMSGLTATTGARPSLGAAPGKHLLKSSSLLIMS